MRPLCRDHTLLYCSEKSRNIAHPLKAHHDHRRVLSRWRRREPSALAWCTYSSSSSCTQVANMGKAGGSQECAKCPTELSWRVGQHIYKYKRIIIRPNERVRRLYGAFLNIRLDNPGAMEVQVAQGGQGLNQGGETDNGGSNYISLLIYMYLCLYTRYTYM